MIFISSTSIQIAKTRITYDGSETLLNGTLSWIYWEEVFGRRDIGYWWAPDSQAIAYLQSDESQVDLAYFTDIAPFLRGDSTTICESRRRQSSRAFGSVELAAPGTRWIQIQGAV
jgi:dipeptidyl-peptidase-4